MGFSKNRFVLSAAAILLLGAGQAWAMPSACVELGGSDGPGSTSDPCDQDSGDDCSQRQEPEIGTDEIVSDDCPFSETQSGNTPIQDFVECTAGVLADGGENAQTTSGNPPLGVEFMEEGGVELPRCVRVLESDPGIRALTIEHDGEGLVARLDKIKNWEFPSGVPASTGQAKVKIFIRIALAVSHQYTIPTNGLMMPYHLNNLIRDTLAEDFTVRDYPDYWIISDSDNLGISKIEVWLDDDGLHSTGLELRQRVLGNFLTPCGPEVVGN